MDVVDSNLHDTLHLTLFLSCSFACFVSYIFPGLGLAVVATGARRVTDSMFLVAAQTLADLVPEEQLETGCLYPPLNMIRSVSAQIAAAVAEEVYRLGLATYAPKPDDLLEFVTSQQYDYRYDSFVH